MYTNSLGLQSRGASNSIASPGISSVFGGGSTSTGRPATASGATYTAAGAMVAPHRPVTEETLMNRYTPTYHSNAFAHTQYEVPLKAPESAAVQTLKTTGTSIEDYGRRNQAFDTNAYRAAHTAGRPATTAGVSTIKREVIEADDPNCMHCTNHSMVNHKKSSHANEKQGTLTFEKIRLAHVKAAENAEIARKQAERQANQQEMTNTLMGIQSKKQAEWDAKKNDRTNLEQSMRLQQENQELTSKAFQERQLGAQNYKSELNMLKEQAIQQNINGKISDRELEQRLNGLTFECYTRDQQMKEETKKTGQEVKSQISDWQSRKQNERQEFVKAPEVFYTDRELDQLRVEAEARQRDVRTHHVENAQSQLNQHFTRKAQENDTRARTVEEERAVHNRMRELEAQELEANRRNRADRQNEMNYTLSAADQAKRDAWEAKKNDQTNKIQSEQLQQEVSQLTRSAFEDSLKQKQSYNQDLTQLTYAQRAQLDQERQRASDEEAKARGLTFECYQRDPLMKQAAKETGGFQLNQREIETLRKQEERSQQVAPPSSLMTTDHLRQLEQEALNQDMEKRSSLKATMMSQYSETLAQKQARLAAERSADAQEAARVADINAQITRQEFQIREDTKKNYGQYLDLQLNDAGRKKQEEEAYRKYDANTERIIQENATIGERIVKCRGCSGTLSHERTHVHH